MKKKATLLASVGLAILNSVSHIDGKRDNTEHFDNAIFLAKTLQISPAEVPLVLETLDKKIVALDKQVDTYSAADADHLRGIRKTVYDNAHASAEADQFARSLFSQLGLHFDSDGQLDLGIGADGTMTGVPDRTRAEDIDPAFVQGASLQGDHRSNGRDKTVAA